MAAAGVSTAVLLAWAAVVLQRTAGTGLALQFTITLLVEAVVLVTILNMVAAMRRTISEQAITDPLTGAFNRRHLEACLATAIERRKRTGSSVAAGSRFHHFESVQYVGARGRRWCWSES
jgi:GGDEF domain-containing protein